jgi:hypothetical protein
MGRVSSYWILFEPNGLPTRSDKSDEAREWFYKKFPDLENISDTSEDKTIQYQLMEIRLNEMSPDGDRQKATYCLRCFISQRLRAGCHELSIKYSRQGFTEEDLYSLVLEDTIQPDRRSTEKDQPLAVKILNKFDPAKGGLGSWTKLRMRQHQPLLEYLKAKGCRLGSATPWALLNDIKNILRLKRILCNSGVFIPERKVLFSGESQLSAFESVSEKLEKIWLALQHDYNRYQAVLLKDNISQGNAPPFLTDERVKQIVYRLQQDSTFSIYSAEEVRQEIESCCNQNLAALENLHRTWHILESYHTTYRSDLIEHRPHAAKPFPDPTVEQLQRMLVHLQKRGFTGYTPRKIRDSLLDLAEKAKAYSGKEPPPTTSIDARTNNASLNSAHSLNDSTSTYSELLKDPTGQDPYEKIEEKDQGVFLNKFSSAFSQSLDESIKKIIDNRIPDKQKQRQRSLQAHYLFYCEGKSFRDIAEELGVTDRTIAGDLTPKRCNDDIRHKILELLHVKVRELGSIYGDQSQLQKFDDEVRKALKEMIAQEFDPAINELSTPNQDFRCKVNVQICHYINKTREDTKL